MSDLNHQEALEALLRTADESIDDDGFTARVMHQLPRRRMVASRRATILSIASLAACLVGFVVFPGVEHIQNLLVLLAMALDYPEPAHWAAATLA